MYQHKNTQAERFLRKFSPTQSFHFIWAFNGLDEANPHWMRTVYFTKSRDSNVNFIPNTHRSMQTYPEYVQSNIWALCGPAKVTHKINHHSKQAYFKMYTEKCRPLKSYNNVDKDESSGKNHST